MKKIVTFLVIAVLCSAANLQVFSQKNRSVSLKKTSVTKNETPQDVKLKSASAFCDGNGVYLKWQTEYENRNLGFFIYRAGKNGNEPVSQSIVGGGRTKSSEEVVYGGEYSYFDAAGDAANSYFIEALQLNGTRKIIGQVFVRTVDDLTSVAGTSSRELNQSKQETEPAAENNLLNLPFEMQEQIDKNSIAPDLDMQRWVASQPGVKIGVKQQGIYRVSRTELQNAGFNVNAPGNQWQLYMDGKQQSIIVGDNDSYIEFYGQGIDTAESATRVYYLIVGAQNGLRMGTTLLRPLAGNISGVNYFQTFQRKERAIYLFADILNGDAENFFGNVPIVGSASPTPAAANVTFNLTGVDFNNPKADFNLNIQGITGTPHQIVPVLNGEPLDPISGNGFNLMPGTYQIPTSFLREGSNTLQLRTYGGSGDINLVESIRVSYSRKYEAVQNRLSFYTNNYRQTKITGFTSPNIRVFDLTFPDNPTLLTNLTIENNAGNYSVTMPSNRGRVAFAAEDSTLLSASSIIANVPSSLATAAHNGELLIVSYSGWMTQANDWANYRRSQGMTVEVVDIEDIYDEFSYGSVDTTGITQFFQFAKNNWQTAPNYILLLGDMSYDFRNYENRAFQNFIPTKRVDTIYEETGSDEALCDFNNDGLAEIAVGRIPARNAATVTQLLNKTMTFEAGLATVNNRGGLCASDLPNGYDFEGVCQRVFGQLPASMPKSFINRGQTDSKTLLLSALNQGPYIVNYSGHGSAGIWDGNWLTITDANNLMNSPNYSLYFMLTCLNGYFLRTDNDSLSEALLKSQNGGSPAVWASTGKTTPDVQEVLATRFYNQLNVGTMTKIGDLVKDAKQNLNGGRDVRLSWALLGDPTMKIKP
jgi:hypothetical protein